MTRESRLILQECYIIEAKVKSTYDEKLKCLLKLRVGSTTKRRIGSNFSNSFSRVFEIEARMVVD